MQVEYETIQLIMRYL